VVAGPAAGGRSFGGRARTFTLPPVEAAAAPEVAVEETVRVYDLPESEDAANFNALYAFFAGEQHDHCPAHFDGSRRAEGQAYFRERYLSRGFVPLDAGPSHLRKPDVTTPTAREIVETFTSMLLGRPPQIHVPIDADTASFYAMVWRHGKLQAAWQRARNMAGSARAAVVVPQLVGGRPSLEVYKPSECRVLRWSDREVCQPAVLVRQRLISKAVRDEQNKVVQRRFWRTQGWDETNYIEFADVPEETDRQAPIAEVKRTPHGCKRCPATWYRNTNEGSDNPWGRHDFAQLEGRCDAIDRLGSQLRGSVGNNTDPTLFHADEEGTRRRHQIRSKGRGVVIQLSEKGKAGFVEISATAIEAAQRYLDRLTDETFALAHCFRITPQLVQAAKSGKHMQVLFRPAENYAALIGVELADAICRVFECFYEMAQHFGVSAIEAPKPETIILPSRIVREPPKIEPEPEGDSEESGAMPLPQSLVGEDSERFEVCAPGRFGAIELTFGEFFEKLAEEKNSELGGLQGASGGQPILSRRTAIEGAARVMGVDPVEECRRIAVEDAEGAQAFKAQAEAMEDKADGEDRLPGEEAANDTPEGEGDDEDATGEQP
jgi:hypothetical protein